MFFFTSKLLTTRSRTRMISASVDVAAVYLTQLIELCLKDFTDRRTNQAVVRTDTL
jgi:hypothetical protein